MSWLDVETAGGQLSIRNQQGVSKAITINGSPVNALALGWRARGVYCGFSSFYILDLVRDSAEFAFWILDENCCFLGNEQLQIQNYLQDRFIVSITQRYVSVARTLSVDTESPQDIEVQDFFRLSRAIRKQLIKLVLPESFEFCLPKVIDLATATNEAFEFTRSSGASIAFDKDLLMRTIHLFLHERFLDACIQGRLKWPLLTENSLGDDVHCIFFSFSYGVLRCVDRKTGLLYYIVICGADIIPCAVFIPDVNVIFGYSTGSTGIYFGSLRLLNNSISVLLANHMTTSTSNLLDWLNRSPNKFATFMCPELGAHLGHFLWNETSGLERIIEKLEPHQFPQIYNLAAPSGCEFYAPLETLFPEFRGIIQSSVGDISIMQDICYSTTVQPIRLSGHKVTAAMRDRLMNVVMNDPDVTMLKPLHRQIFENKWPIIVLGLRLSDRTHHDLMGFYCKVIDRLLLLVPHLTIVFDGLNSRPAGARGSTFAVFSGNRDTSNLYEREKELVTKIREVMSERPVDIIDCIGSSMRINLFWIFHAAMFISPWGAGLVKYRWICNKIGFVFSSRNNLTQPHHLHIYHSPEFMDNPAEIEFVDPANVTDLRKPHEVLDENGRDLSEQQGGLSSVNFDLANEQVLERITGLFIQILNTES